MALNETNETTRYLMVECTATGNGEVSQVYAIGQDGQTLRPSEIQGLAAVMLHDVRRMMSNEGRLASEEERAEMRGRIQDVMDTAHEQARRLLQDEERGEA